MVAGGYNLVAHTGVKIMQHLKIVEQLGMAEASDRIVYKEWSEPKDGMWSPDPNKPGLGLELDPEAVEKYAVGADAPRTQL